MSQVYTAFTSFAADYERPADEKKLPPPIALLVFIGLGLAAWVPVLLPLYLLLGR
jgi:hypothetical protein